MVLWTVNFTSFASKIYCLFLSVGKNSLRLNILNNAGERQDLSRYVTNDSDREAFLFVCLFACWLVCLFVCLLGVFRPTRENLSLIWRRLWWVNYIVTLTVTDPTSLGRLDSCTIPIRSKLGSYKYVSYSIWLTVYCWTSQSKYCIDVDTLS